LRQCGEFQAKAVIRSRDPEVADVYRLIAGKRVEQWKWQPVST